MFELILFIILVLYNHDIRLTIKQNTIHLDQRPDVIPNWSNFEVKGHETSLNRTPEYSPPTLNLSNLVKNHLCENDSEGKLLVREISNFS